MFDVTKPNRNPTYLFFVLGLRLAKATVECQAVAPGLTIFEGWRHPKRQEWLYAEGRTRPGKIRTQAVAWRSWHQLGLSADVAVKSPEGEWSWDFDTAAVQAIMLENGLERGPKFEDCHFQLTGGLDMELARSTAKVGGIPALWAMLEGRVK